VEGRQPRAAFIHAQVNIGHGECRSTCGKMSSMTFEESIQAGLAPGAANRDQPVHTPGKARRAAARESALELEKILQPGTFNRHGEVQAGGFESLLNVSTGVKGRTTERNLRAFEHDAAPFGAIELSAHGERRRHGIRRRGQLPTPKLANDATPFELERINGTAQVGPGVYEAV